MNQYTKRLKALFFDLKLASMQQISSWQTHRDLNDYLKSDRRPWRRGFHFFRAKYIENSIYDEKLLEVFKFKKPLPKGFGFRIDARVVEIPWALSKLTDSSGQLLDAGSSFNMNYVLTSYPLTHHKITIATLAPESTCYWNLGISYVFSDLRCLNFRDNWFDNVVCISTIEHVGMDNSFYAGPSDVAQRSNSNDFLSAIGEIRRILKPGGKLYITFPFGLYEDHGWFQQFDSSLTDTLINEFNPTEFDETVFKYDPEGWKLSDRFACSNCNFFDVRKSKYFDPKSVIEYPEDYPAGERAVMCLEMEK
jgi:SAM-dependent methyltransferase